MNRQYWRPQLHYIYLLYIFYSIMYLISSFLYIFIRKPGVLQQQSKRASLEEKEGRTTQGPGLSKSPQASPPTFLHRFAAPGQTVLPAACLSGFGLCRFSRAGGSTEGPRDRSSRQAGRCGDSSPLPPASPKQLGSAPHPLTGCALEILKVVQPDIKNRWVRISF